MGPFSGTFMRASAGSGRLTGLISPLAACAARSARLDLRFQPGKRVPADIACFDAANRGERRRVISRQAFNQKNYLKVEHSGCSYG